ncbi:MAG: adenine-specific methyltransferase EcoRI family protein [Treponema sp.]|nr:adenine-specific methyltransferase EcoRI family protein [Spirochaetia bacterium]MDD7460808.1 adenine-specific methyltransferase EcoRI family protein [Spirochaetales bacterium]MDY5812850.1 adenine-specific methyltransferase EcoRI family protein [Treponema sp.]
MANENLKSAKKNKNDEFYTQYEDIQKEVNAYLEYNPDTFKDKTVLLPCDDPEWSNFTRFFAQNFENLGLKKLISTSFSAAGKCKKYGDKDADGYYQLSLFEEESPQFDRELSVTKGKIFILDRDTNSSGKIDIDALEWHYMDGDGDFRSKEVKALRNEADIIVTNPPFSLFREFLAWIVEADKKFLIIGNINCISYKEVFPLIKENKIWLGNGMGRWISGFIVPESYGLYGTEARIEDGKRIVATNNCLWLTNLDHGRRHQPLQLMTMADNLKFSKHKEIKENGYPKYDNYDAIEVPYTDSIPSDYDGAMGVPITFLDKYCPEQFEILGITENNATEQVEEVKLPNCLKHDRPYLNEHRMYSRILIRRK